MRSYCYPVNINNTYFMILLLLFTGCSSTYQKENYVLPIEIFDPFSLKIIGTNINQPVDSININTLFWNQELKDSLGIYLRAKNYDRLPVEADIFYSDNQIKAIILNFDYTNARAAIRLYQMIAEEIRRKSNQYPENTFGSYSWNLHDKKLNIELLLQNFRKSVVLNYSRL